MAQGDLTSLANLKSWLGATTTNNDVVLGRLVSAASASVLRYIARPFVGATLVTERYDGRGGDTLVLRQGPVSSIASIAFSGSVITTAATGNPPTGGYILDCPALQARLILTDLYFPHGKGQIQVSYWAGWQVAGEAHTAAASVTPSQLWLTDVGVTYATGAALTAVAANPAVGQYAVSAAGAYTFSAVDIAANAALLISYGTAPYDMEQVVLELAGETYSRMDRIGLGSKTLAGQEIITFSQMPLNNAAKGALDRFRRVAPV